MSASTSSSMPTARLIPMSPSSAREEGPCVLHALLPGEVVPFHFPDHEQARQWCKENGFEVQESSWARRLRGLA